MRLTRIRIRGFKSFADETELVFDRGVGVIVGPNGSGKSNIAESLRWAMASQAPSEVRVASGLDVLFSGSEGRAAAGLAEVELVLEDEGGVAPGGRPELSIMRRLSRDGESAYLLNRLPVRRLDVHEVLADVGLGRDSHAIIGQNQVDQVLLASPSARRGLIEEVAGLGKYKRRRVRAQQKLSRVERQLVEARTRRAEIQGRLRPLAVQASAAERAALLEAELLELRLELVLSATAEARRDRQARQADLRAAREAQGALDAAAAAVVARRQAAEAALGALVTEQEAASRLVQRLDAAVERLRDRALALGERREEFAADAERLRVRAGRLIDEAATTATAAAGVEMDAERERSELAADPDDTGLEDRFAQAVQASEAALAATLEARRAEAEHEGRLARARAEAAELAERATAASERREELAAGVGEREEARRLARVALEDIEARVAGARAELAGLERAEHGARTAAAAARTAEAAARAASAAADARAHAVQARLEEECRAVERGDGLHDALVQLRERGIALVADRIRPEAGLERAVAAVLSWRATEAVARDAEDAVDLLADDAFEGAALLCLDRLPARAAEGPGVPLASRVQADDDLPAGLLDGVLLVERPADLLAMRRGIGVLADGRGFDADRGIAFRAGDAAGRAIARRRDLGAVERQARADQDAAEGATRALLEAARGREAAEAAEAEAHTRIATAREALTALEREHGETAREADRLARADEATAERLRAAADEADQTEARAAATATEVAALDRGLDGLRTRVQERAAEHEAAEAVRLSLQGEVADRRGRRAASEERAERARVEAARLRALASDQERQAERAGAGARRLAAVVDRLPTAIAVIEGALVAAERHREPARAATRAGEQRVAELGEELRACAEEDARLGAERRDGAGRVAALGVEVERCEERLGDLAERRRRLLGERGEEAGEVVDSVEPLPEDERRAREGKVERLERRIGQLGVVNPLAKEAYEEAKAEADDITAQITDLERSVAELRKLVRELGRAIRDRFEATYRTVEEGFAEVIGTLFPGGSGRLRLVEPAAVVPLEEGEEPIEAEADPEAAADPDDPDAAPEEPEPGVELEVQPAGKRIRSLTVLSGGEKSMAALGFTFALMLARPSPFYVLDEVDAALDEVNIDRFLELVDRFRDRAQFIVITHQAGTMEAADALYGVSMPGNGVSQVISRRLPRGAGDGARLGAAPSAAA
ncbi:MAG: chromosome segregation protein SMC [Actinobacteria bacterium]|nr:chromosome segregation protein SMC [Actinomycetota bacterium]